MDKCVPNSSLGEVISNPETKLAEDRGEHEAFKQGGTLCNQTLDTQAAAWVGATKQISTNTPLALAGQATLLWQTQKKEEATLERELRQKQEKRRLWLTQRKAEVFAEAKEQFHVPGVGLDADNMYPKGDLAGVKVGQPVTAIRDNAVLGEHCGDRSNILTQDPPQAGAGSGRPEAVSGQSGAVP